MDSKEMTSNRKQRKISPKGILPLRVIALSAGITLVGLIGLLFLSLYIDSIKEDYNQIVKRDYENLEYVNQVSRAFYKHQTLAFRYMTALDDRENAAVIENEAYTLEKEIEDLCRQLGDNVIKTSYESEYHDILSGFNGYFNKVSYVFEFNNSGDVATAEYYMDNTLSKEISGVEDTVDKLNHLITQDVTVAQVRLANKLAVYKNAEGLLIIVLAVIAVLGYSRCAKITYDIINKDALTQVHNIGHLSREMMRRLKKGQLDNYTCVCSNIKGLSLVNRRHGTAVGDMVLRRFASVMAQTVSKDERMARIGGDNFVFVVRDERLDEILQILGRVTVPVEVDGTTKIFNLENRCGIYNIEGNDDFETIMDAAYLAVHRAKQTALPDNIWFDNELLQQMFDRKNILSQYKKGIGNREFVAYYHPKVNMKNNTMCGCEALVRWKQGDSLVPPFKFIPLLEDEGSIVELDFYVFDIVCQDIRTWLEVGMNPVRVSSNFSKLHLQNDDFAERILGVVNKYQVPHELVEIELTESSGYENFQALKAFVEVMKTNNIYVSIDDFGTGYSSLSLLKDLDVDVIKLDKSFVDEVEHGDTVQINLVKNVIHMIRDLKRDIICEGVETKEQAEFLMEQDCYMVQGYLYDKPLSHDEFEERLRNPEYKLK